jgi:hypothetical protein
MMKQTRYSIKKYILLLVASPTAALIIITALLSALGLPTQGILVIVIIWFPICLFSVLYAFYGALVRHYGLKGDEKLFFGGKF